MPVSRAFFYTPSGVPNKRGLLIKQNLIFLSKSLVKELPSIFPPMELLWREMLHFQSQWFILSFISLRIPI
jgi:hypothetical protein